MKAGQKTATADDIFGGTVLVTVPHMDDAVLGCGGTLLQAKDKQRIHVVYCTRGDCPGFDRAQEARNALGAAGIPAANISFLGFPDWHLKEHDGPLRRALESIVATLGPDRILTPFRFDRHPDHVALNHVVRALAAAPPNPIEVCEYFVYFTWRLLPGGDVRRHIKTEHIVQVDTAAQASAKRALVGYFKSQTEAPAPGQLRPALTKAHLDVACTDVEYFVRHGERLPDTVLFTLPLSLIRFVHGLEPVLKIWKEWIKTRLARGRGEPVAL